DALQPRRVGLILYGMRAMRERLPDDFRALTDRVGALGSKVALTDFVDLGAPDIEQRLADALKRQHGKGASLILMAGESAIMHRNDMAPRAVECAGGVIETVGAPVEPGNLLMLAYLDGVPVLGAPGCARSPKANVVDQIIPRLLVGERL